MDRYSAIRYAVRFPVVGKYLFQLFGLLGALLLVPCLFALVSGSISAAGAYAAIIAVFLILGFQGRKLPAPDRVQKNEAAAVVGLAFVTSSLAFSLPVMTYGVRFVDAWFESVSGVTTTGLSTIDPAAMPDAFLFARGWSQWVGGIGVVVLALAVLFRSGHAAQTLGFSRSEMGNTVGGTRAHARRVVLIYLILTAFGVVALTIAGARPLDAVVHAMTAVSTGGFANHGDSLVGASTSELLIINLLCLAGAVSFHVYYVSLVGFDRLRRMDGQFYSLLLFVVLFAALILGIGRLTGATFDAFEIVTLVISSQSTAGFTAIEVTALPAWVLLILCLSMFIGGGVGSTSGGIKLGRLLFILTWMRTYFVRSSLPDTAHVDIRLGGRVTTDADIQDVFAVVGAFVMVLFASWLVFVIQGYPAAASLFEVTSALATAGLSAGIVTTELPDALKYLLCFDMLFGRLEVVILLVLFMPGTWFGRRRRLGMIR